MSNDFLVFSLGQQQFALPVRQVSTVVPRARLTPLPAAPADLLGVLRLRGALYPVVDIRVRLRLPVAAPHIGECIVVMHTTTQQVGLLVDAVAGLVPGGADPLALTTLDAEAVVRSEVRAYLAALASQLHRVVDQAAA